MGRGGGRSSSSGSRSSSSSSSSKSSNSASPSLQSSRPAPAASAPQARNASTMAHPPPPIHPKAKPPPPASASTDKKSTMGTMIRGAAMGLGAGMLGAILFPKLFGGETRPLETSDFLYGGAGAIAGSGGYSFYKHIRRAPPKIWVAAVLGGIGACGGIIYNSSRLGDWERVVDETTGKPYYLQHSTGSVQWEKPH